MSKRYPAVNTLQTLLRDTASPLNSDWTRNKRAIRRTMPTEVSANSARLTAISQAGTLVTVILSSIDNGAENGNRLIPTTSGLFGALTIAVQKKKGNMIGSMRMNVKEFADRILGANAPKPAMIDE
jgi:hypothetical protein